MALSGMSIVADACRPVTLTSIFERRCPSVVTMRTTSPSHSKSAEFRCARVSSVEIEKCVLAMSSCSTSTSSASDGDPSAGDGSGGKSSPGMPRSVYRRALPAALSVVVALSCDASWMGPSGIIRTRSSRSLAGTATLPPLLTSAGMRPMSARYRSVAATRSALGSVDRQEHVRQAPASCSCARRRPACASRA